MKLNDLLAAQPEHSQFNRWLCVGACAVVIWLWLWDIIGAFGKDKNDS